MADQGPRQQPPKASAAKQPAKPAAAKGKAAGMKKAAVGTTSVLNFFTEINLVPPPPPPVASPTANNPLPANISIPIPVVQAAPPPPAATAPPPPAAPKKKRGRPRKVPAPDAEPPKPKRPYNKKKKPEETPPVIPGATPSAPQTPTFASVPPTPSGGLVLPELETTMTVTTTSTAGLALPDAADPMAVNGQLTPGGAAPTADALKPKRKYTKRAKPNEAVVEGAEGAEGAAAAAAAAVVADGKGGEPPRQKRKYTKRAKPADGEPTPNKKKRKRQDEDGENGQGEEDSDEGSEAPAKKRAKAATGGGGGGKRGIKLHNDKSLDFLKEALARPVGPYLFPKWTPLRSRISVLADADKYFPEEEESPPFAIVNWGADTEIELPATTTLSRFQSMKLNAKDFFLYLGGPIWALDWCPHEMHRPTDHQYLACGVYKRNEAHTWRGPNFAEDSAIQIWDMGPLGFTSDTGIPKLVLLLAHPYGPCWDLSWCPRGSPPNRPPQSPDELRRLGLLAGVFGDGSLRIFSVPNPSEYYQDQPVVLRLEPVFQAKLDSASLSCVRWSPHGQCNAILAGSDDGTVAVWALVEEPSAVRVTSFSAAYSLYDLADSNQDNAADADFQPGQGDEMDFQADQDEPDDEPLDASKIDDSTDEEVEEEEEDDWKKKGKKSKKTPAKRAGNKKKDIEVVAAADTKVELDTMGVMKVNLAPFTLKAGFSVPTTNAPIARLEASSGPITAVSWNPLASNQFAAASLGGDVSVYDCSDVTAPLFACQTGQVIRDVDWLGKEYSCIIVGTDGGLRSLHPLFVQANRFVHPYAVFGVSVSQILRYNLSSDGDGNVFYTLVTNTVAMQGKRRPQNTALVEGIRQFPNNVLGFIDTIKTDKLHKPGAIVVNKVVGMELMKGEQVAIPFPPPIVAIHRTRWNPNPYACNWAVYGGQAGILRLRRRPQIEERRVLDPPLELAPQPLNHFANSIASLPPSQTL